MADALPGAASGKGEHSCGSITRPQLRADGLRATCNGKCDARRSEADAIGNTEVAVDLPAGPRFFSVNCVPSPFGAGSAGGNSWGEQEGRLPPPPGPNPASYPNPMPNPRPGP